MLKLDISKLTAAGSKGPYVRDITSSRMTKDILTTSRPRFENMFAAEHVHDIPEPLTSRNVSSDTIQEDCWELSDSEDIESVSQLQCIDMKLRRSQADLNKLKSRLLRLSDAVKCHVTRLAQEIDKSQKCIESM